MYWLRSVALLLLSANGWAAGEYVVAGGVQADSADGIAGVLLGDVAVGDATWLSAGVARSSVELPIRDQLETWYADAGLDHFFDPAGIRFGVAYWGDNSVLDSKDARGSVYFRGGRGSLSFDYEFRDLQLELPEFDFIRRRQVNFDAHGYGLGARLDLTDDVDIRFKGMRYDYSINLRLDPNRDIVNLISVSRLSLLNTLVDYRASLSLGIDFGLKRLEFEAGQWEGAVEGSTTNSYSMRFLAPIGRRNDIEFGLGFDESENYGEVTVFSVLLYFYGGGWKPALKRSTAASRSRRTASPIALPSCTRAMAPASTAAAAANAPRSSSACG